MPARATVGAILVPRRAASLGVVLAVLCGSGRAHGEYVENQMGRADAAITLGVAGSAALAFDIANVVYLAGGSGGQAGRIVTGVGSLMAGSGLVVGSAIALSVVGEDHIPGGAANEDSEEARALTETRVMGGINIALAAVSVALGLGAIVTFDGDAPRRSRESSWLRLQPWAGTDGGAGIGIAGAF